MSIMSPFLDYVLFTSLVHMINFMCHRYLGKANMIDSTTYIFSSLIDIKVLKYFSSPFYYYTGLANLSTEGLIYTWTSLLSLFTILV